MDADRFVEAQKVLGLRTKDIAALIGVSSSQWCQIRSGQTWKTGIPEDKRSAVEAMFEQAGLNGHEPESETHTPPEEPSPPLQPASDGEKQDSGKTDIPPKKEPAAKPEKPDPLKLILEQVEIWHAKDGLDDVGFVTVSDGKAEDGRRLVRHYKARSRGFAKWLRAALFTLGISPKRDMVKDMLDTIDALCQVRGDKHEAWWRTGWHRDGSLWVDLASSDNTAVKITAEGWMVEPITRKAPRLVRGDSMGTMPVPTDADGVGLDVLLTEHLNLTPNYADDDDDEGRDEGIRNARIAAAWSISAMKPEAPRWHLNVVGEQGSAKSTGCRQLKRLVDPSEIKDMAPPKTSHDLAVVAAGQRVISLDNLSKMSPEMSDVLARMATGSTIGGRALFTNHETTALAVSAAAILNGIPDTISRPDLVERTLALKLYPPARRLLESEVEARYSEALPKITAALMDGLAGMLRRRDEVVGTLDREKAPRMIDPYVWAEAAGRSWGWPEWRLLEYLEAAQREAAEEILNSDTISLSIMGAVAMYLRTHKDQAHWKGQASELLEIARYEAQREEYEMDFFPKHAKGMDNAMRRLAKAMRLIGWTTDNVRDGRGNDRASRWILKPPSAESC